MTTAQDDFERFVGIWADFTPEEDHVFQEILEERAGFMPSREGDDVPEPFNQVFVAALLTDKEQPGSMMLEDYAELYNITLDADAYRREFPEDAPFTHPSMADE